MGTLRLHSLDATAETSGLFVGQTLADARAICPDLIAVEAHLHRDAQAFEEFCEGFIRYSPAVSLQRIGEAFIDITGCERLFGGERAIVADVAMRLQRVGIYAHIAVAQTPGAAYAFASCGIGGIIPPEETKAALAPLPVEALRIDAAVAENLRRLGLKRIGQLYDMPRAPLTARFTKQLLTRLGQALGHEAEPLPLLFPSPRYYAEMRFIDPVVSNEEIMKSVKNLATELARALSNEGRGARCFELTLFRVDNEILRISVRASDLVQSPTHIARLFADRIAPLKIDVDAGFGFEQARLSSFETGKVATLQYAAFERAAADTALSELKDRLSNRLGARHVCRIDLKDSHLPEYADALVPSAEPEDAMISADVRLRRPVKILPKPEIIEVMAQVPDGPPIRFRWRRVSYRITRASGPERIADEWRRQEGVRPTRDYYRVEDENGRRYWVYREGLYERETQDPKWFLHGFFA